MSNSSNYFPGGYDEYEIFQKSSLLDSGNDEELKNIFLKLLPSSIPGKALVNYLLVLISQGETLFAGYLFHGDIPDALFDTFANSTIYKIVQNEGGLSSTLAQVFYEQSGQFYRTVISFDGMSFIEKDISGLIFVRCDEPYLFDWIADAIKKKYVNIVADRKSVV